MLLHWKLFHVPCSAFVNIIVTATDIRRWQVNETDVFKLLQFPEAQDQPSWICVYFTFINVITETTVGFVFTTHLLMWLQLVIRLMQDRQQGYNGNMALLLAVGAVMPFHRLWHHFIWRRVKIFTSSRQCCSNRLLIAISYWIVRMLKTTGKYNPTCYMVTATVILLTLCTGQGNSDSFISIRYSRGSWTQTSQWLIAIQSGWWMSL